MSDSTLVPASSPFDAIRRTRPDGSEYWSARDLQPLLGYDKWQRFAVAIDRAQIAAKAQGQDVTTLFPQVAQLTAAGNLGDQVKQDYELARFAAYLVAMNGDPRKTEVAAAQAYFAIRTNQAEQIEKFVGKPLDLVLAQANLIAAFKGIIDDKHLEAKARIVLARGLGETPEIPQEILPLYAQTYLEEKGMSHSDVKSHASNFGKRVKAAYMLLHGKEPMKYPLETANGQIRSVYAYTENDRHIMDSVWSLHYQ